MLYLSQLLRKDITHGNKSYGKVLDLIVSEDRQVPYISKILIKQRGKKTVIPSDSVYIENNKLLLKTTEVAQLPHDDKDFYLAEDLLDKQVIDINGKRLVRVNDIALKENGGIKVEGIDIGMSGVFRRLGIDYFNMRSITLPWSLIESFDYQTGQVQLKLTQSKLNTLHPADIADILEEAGSKERVGLVKALDAKKAASAIEEANEETQSAILEEVPSNILSGIINKMRSSTLADIVDTLNPFTTKQIFKTLETENAKRLKKLLIFEDDEAGGLMDFSFFDEKASKTVGEILAILAKKEIRPETIVITDDERKLIGTISSRLLINNNNSVTLGVLVKQKHYVYEDAPFSQIFRIFAQYNLRLLPVVDREKKVIGAITIDSILAQIQEEEERSDAI